MLYVIYNIYKTNAPHFPRFNYMLKIILVYNYIHILYIIFYNMYKTKAPHLPRFNYMLKTFDLEHYNS